jgi:hypothetical protein
MKLKYLCLSLIALAVSSSVLIAMPQQAKAVSAADWKAGRIIDDAVFFNRDSMSVQQIQDFLNAKVPGCDRWNPTRFTYAGKPYGPPYTCLKEYQENPTTKENNIGRFNPDGSPYNVPGGWSAAQILKDASNSYGINPQVLIVMLQKETAIVTDTWAAGWQYDRAMGYGCPDNGPNNTANCSASYYGFYNQVGNAAWQLKRYTTNPNEYNFKAGVTRNILWQVGGVCGSSPVYLENAATAALYNYTPYQPNQAALNNLYGTGDGCSAYGNRNFWRIFNDWFGSTESSITRFINFDLPHPSGAIIRKYSGGPVYKVTDEGLIQIPTYTVFLSNGYSDKNIKIMNKGDEGIPVSKQVLAMRNGTLIRGIGDPRIYVVECATQYYSSCMKRHILNYDTFIYLGYRDPLHVYTIPQVEVSSIPDGPIVSGQTQHPNGSLVSEQSTGKIYIIKNNIRYHIPTANVFNLNRYDWNKVLKINQQDLTLNIGTGYPAYDSNLLARTGGDPRVWAIGDNTYGTTYRKHITTYSTFQNLGYYESEIFWLESPVLFSYPAIPAFPY